MSFSDLLRNWFRFVLEPLARFFNGIGITPNMMTYLGLLGNALAGVFLALGNMLLGGVLVLVMGPIDALDGTMARLRGEPTAFGAFVDSVSDRYSELFILGGLLYYFITLNHRMGILLVYLAASGSVLVSYVRARGEALGFSPKVGILTRAERYLVMAPSLLINQPIIALWVIAIFGHFTALQRIWQVRSQAKAITKKKLK